MRKKKMIIGILSVVLIISVVCLGLSIEKVEGGIFVKFTPITPYSYTVYDDYVELNKYRGSDKEILVPNSILGKPVKVIGEECFYSNSKIEKVILHEDIEIIGGHAFTECENLVEITGGRNIKEIGKAAFEKCSNLEVVSLGGNVERILNLAFSECSKLISFEKQDNLLFVGVKAFNETAIEDIYLSENVEIKRWAFQGTPWLENHSDEYVIVGKGHLIYYNGSESEISIPDGVKVVTGGTFYELKDAEVYVPESVIAIERNAFDACENIKVYIPASVTEIGTDEGALSIVTRSTDFAIVTTQDSCAHKYALENDIACEIVEKW